MIAGEAPEILDRGTIPGWLELPPGRAGFTLWPRSILTRLMRLRPAWRRLKARRRLEILPTLQMAAPSSTFSIRKKSETARRALTEKSLGRPGPSGSGWTLQS